MLVEEKITPTRKELEEIADKDPYFYKFIEEYHSSPPVIGKRIIQKVCSNCGGTALEPIWDREPSDGDHACDANPSYISHYVCNHCGANPAKLKVKSVIEEITMPNWRTEVKQIAKLERDSGIEILKHVIEKKALDVKQQAEELQKNKRQLTELKESPL